MSVQHLLFDDLPETERARKPARRSRATTIAAPMAVDVVREAAPDSARPARPSPVLASLPLAPPAPPAPPPPFDPAALSNPELRALVQAIPDQRLAYLLIEAARELKRRALPDRAEDDDSGEAVVEPNPLLLRAARQVVGELSGEDS
ncbi:hypothetical protein [Azospirillum doebereinerae]|uniref:Uncharacterized protein n=1 Tax=Azospirillum doebereinerae TaxID=92933 RepID=A0A3S0V8I7_9PROT|nr:hypothetical protein [Azospirillum doebereinerae]MCG5239286.1 hypothetical protein [Azospirillum doebereinerae]RUQ75159.1 hypothetical protein EJ913_04725 [Azospirillum doebereinerae]